MTLEFIEEAKKKPNFDVLYENKFPLADLIDDRGYVTLLTENEFENAIGFIPAEGRIGVPRLSVDVARGGGNFNVWVLRWDNYATLLAKNHDPDTMSVATTTITLAKEYGVYAENVFIDDNGVGGGVTDRLSQLRFFVNPVKSQERADDDEQFSNRRAQNYWRARQWIIDGGKLSPEHESDWQELLDIKYRAMDTRKIQILSKILMAKDGIDSPDVSDAFAQGFDQIYAYDPKEANEFVSESSFDRLALF
jgi:hypothetical protein